MKLKDVHLKIALYLDYGLINKMSGEKISYFSQAQDLGPAKKAPPPPWVGFLAGMFTRGKQCTDLQKKSMMMCISVLIG